ncbi:hypothetical protein A6J60_010660 [Psychrobacter sp. FDAARGOS_221]|nr:hypothetical protein A6J60_010660 [Psychrobacter sp. FDAARGOS_221]
MLDIMWASMALLKDNTHHLAFKFNLIPYSETQYTEEKARVSQLYRIIYLFNFIDTFLSQAMQVLITGKQQGYTNQFSKHVLPSDVLLRDVLLSDILFSDIDYQSVCLY